MLQHNSSLKEFRLHGELISVGIGVVVVSVTAVTVIMAVIGTAMLVMMGVVLMPFARSGADTLDMMVMAFLNQTYFVFEAKHLLAVLAHLTVHVAGALKYLKDPVDESVYH